LSLWQNSIPFVIHFVIEDEQSRTNLLKFYLIWILRLYIFNKKRVRKTKIDNRRGAQRNLSSWVFAFPFFPRGSAPVWCWAMGFTKSGGGLAPLTTFLNLCWKNKVCLPSFFKKKFPREVLVFLLYYDVIWVL